MLEEFAHIPIYRKASEILSLTQAIVGSYDPEEDQMMSSHFLMEDALTLCAKIASAEGVDYYFLKMENAVLIKLAARNLRTGLNNLSMQNLSSKEHLDLLRAEIDAFKELFVEWVEGFDPSVNESDGWGLFGA